MNRTPIQSLDFVVFSDDWGRHPSSTQHLFTQIKREHRVLWVNTIGLRSAKADGFTFRRGLEKLREWTRPFRQIDANLAVYAPVMLPAFGSGLLGALNRAITAAGIRRVLGRLGMARPVLLASIPTAVDYAGGLGESAVAYYITDDYALWPGGNAEAIRSADKALTDTADLILPCSEALAETHRRAGTTVRLLPHAVDLDHFARTDLPEPNDLAKLPRPRVCFFGLIYEKIDLPAIANLARQRPELQVVLLGPVQCDTSALHALPNVHLLGAKPYSQLPAHLCHTDALVIPYVLDEETAAKGPLKIRECLAVGKPTVARDIPNLRQFADVVGLYDDPADLPDILDHALAKPPEPLAMRKHVAGQTWQARAEELLAAVREVTASPNRNGVKARPALDGEAARYLQQRKDLPCWCDPRWAEVFQHAYGLKMHWLASWRGGRVVGVLPLVAQRGLAGSRLVSLPWFDSAGIVADDEQAARDLHAGARRLMHRLGVGELLLRHEQPLVDSHATRTDKVTLRLSLPADPEELWSALKAKVRNQVRKADKAGLVVVRGGADLLRDFYAVYSRTMRDLGSPCHSLRFFHWVGRLFADDLRITTVRLGSQPIAAGLTLRDRLATRIPWAGADWRHRKLNANMLMYWEILADACRDGSACFDFGRSTRNAGTCKFKKQWGAEEVQLYWQSDFRRPTPNKPHAPTDSPAMQRASRLWEKLPLPLANQIGPLLIRQLP